MSRHVLALLLVAVLGALGAGASPPLVQADVIERVVAVVNEEAIFLSDLRRRAMPFAEQALAASDEQEKMARVQQLYGQLLELLIDEALIQQTARKMRVRVTSEEVDRALENVRQQNNLSEEDFREAIEMQGTSIAQYRTEVRRQLLRLKVLNQRARGRVNITEEDVKRRYRQLVSEQSQSLRFRAAHVFFALAPQSTAAEVAALMQKAKQARSKLNAENFSEAITEYGGGELGWLTQGDLPEDLDRVLAGLQPGELSEPLRGPQGVHILLLHERERGGGQVGPYAQMRDRIQQVMLEQAMQRQQQLFLKELRRDSVVSKRL